ncbi:hypothetical protein [Enterobacter sp. CGMCC 5087]|nr:hypothetical protein [Enterobacter sp. CGMCC 5087]
MMNTEGRQGTSNMLMIKPGIRQYYKKAIAFRQVANVAVYAGI